MTLNLSTYLSKITRHTAYYNFLNIFSIFDMIITTNLNPLGIV